MDTASVTNSDDTEFSSYIRAKRQEWKARGYAHREQNRSKRPHTTIAPSSSSSSSSLSPCRNEFIHPIPYVHWDVRGEIRASDPPTYIRSLDPQLSTHSYIDPITSRISTPPRRSHFHHHTLDYNAINHLHASTNQMWKQYDPHTKDFSIQSIDHDLRTRINILDPPPPPPPPSTLMNDNNNNNNNNNNSNNNNNKMMMNMNTMNTRKQPLFHIRHGTLLNTVQAYAYDRAHLEDEMLSVPHLMKKQVELTAQLVRVKEWKREQETKAKLKRTFVDYTERPKVVYDWNQRNKLLKPGYWSNRPLQTHKHDVI